MFLARGLSTSCQVSKKFLNQPRSVLKSQNLFCRSLSSKPDDDLLLRIKIEPIKRPNEPLENKKARLIYQSRKRGILENDLLLGGFAAKHLREMTPEELQEYDSLLDELDWDIYYWATKNYSISPIPEKWKDSEVMKKLQVYAENREKKILRMPDLREY